MRWIVEDRGPRQPWRHRMVWVGEEDEPMMSVVNRATSDDPYWTRDVHIRPWRSTDPDKPGPNAL